MPDSYALMPRRRPALFPTMTVWVRLSSDQGANLVAMARANGVLADEQARLLLLRGISEGLLHVT
jgi:hypothetical protein